MKRFQYEGKELLPVKLDVVFKAVFISDGNLELLASLLSAILGLELESKDLSIMNSELPATHESGKLSRLDIRVRTSSGRHINVEIQLKELYNMEKRSLYYLAKLYTEQMVAGMQFENICPTIAINILDYNFLPFEECHNCYRMRHIVNGHELTDAVEIHFIELKKVPISICGGSMKDLWMQFLATDKEEVLDMLKEQSPILEKAVDRLAYVSANEQLRYEAFLREKAELDYWDMHLNAIDKGMEKGVKQGLEQGLEQGSANAKIEIARNMKQMGMEIELITKATNLSVEEIKKL